MIGEKEIRTIAVTPGRKKRTLEFFFRFLSAYVLEKLQTISNNQWQQYCRVLFYILTFCRNEQGKETFK